MSRSHEDVVTNCHGMFQVGKDAGIEIPEADYPQLDIIDHCVTYIAARHAA